jgi:cobalt-precorrin-5B (C1)-methyltransferase
MRVQGSGLRVQDLPQEVPVILPNGETIHVPVTYGDGYVSVFKEAGDDPGVTNGIEIRACLTPVPSPEGKGGVVIRGGIGVGRFTLPGFDYPPGEPAINKGPREMIRRNLEPFTLNHESLTVVISVPQGEEIAKRTFNPRLGIEGGISIIGVSGIVEPFSEEAFIQSIHKCMEVAKASGSQRVVINSGAKSERFVKAHYPTLPSQAFVEYGNYIGETLKIANELGFKKITLGVMLGKAVKLAEGQLDTHSRKGTMNLAFVQQMLDEANCQFSIQNTQLSLARELWEKLPKEKTEAFCQVVIRYCLKHCKPLVPQAELTLLLIADDGTIHSL